jgi:hypothetical protein
VSKRVVAARHKCNAWCAAGEGSRLYAPHERITGPDQIIKAVLERSDFEPVYEEPKKPADQPEKEK